MTLRSRFVFDTLLVLAVAGCGGGSSTSSMSSTAAGSASTSAAAPTSSAPSPANSSGENPPAASGDFCSLTEQTLKTATAYVDAMTDPDHAKLAKAATAARKQAVAGAPSEIKEDVRITAALSDDAQAGLEGTEPDPEFDIKPQTLDRITSAANAWKTWTEKNCSAEVAALWKAETTG